MCLFVYCLDSTSVNFCFCVIKIDVVHKSKYIVTDWSSQVFVLYFILLVQVLKSSREFLFFNYPSWQFWEQVWKQISYCFHEPNMGFFHVWRRCSSTKFQEELLISSTQTYNCGPADHNIRTIKIKFNLVIQKTNMWNYGDGSFAAATPKLWNNLPLFLRNSTNIITFYFLDVPLSIF